MVRAHQPGESTFKSILPEQVEWQSFPAFPQSAKLAVLVGDPTRRIRQMGDRQHKAVGQHQLAAGCRAGRGLGCVYRFAKPSCRTKRNKIVDGQRISQAWRRGKPPPSLPGPNHQRLGAPTESRSCSSPTVPMIIDQEHHQGDDQDRRRNPDRMSTTEASEHRPYERTDDKGSDQ